MFDGLAAVINTAFNLHQQATLIILWKSRNLSEYPVMAVLDTKQDLLCINTDVSKMYDISTNREIQIQKCPLHM